MPILPATEANFDAEVPIIVVGAGACGLVAALAATSGGGEVVVLERDPVPQGSTALSSGLIPAAGTKAQKAQGLIDSADQMARISSTKHTGEMTPPWSRLFVNNPL